MLGTFVGLVEKSGVERVVFVRHFFTFLGRDWRFAIWYKIVEITGFN